MRLTDDEKGMLNGRDGPAVRKSMEILVALGDIYDAECMIPISSVHMPGASIVATGEAGLHFVEEMAADGRRFSAFTTLNPCAIDRNKWRELSLRDDEVAPQFRLTRAYEKMGAVSCHSCTPYFIGNLPHFGEHIGWGESSAVAYSNSVLGARTNREGGPSALAAAVTGRVPAYGFHLPRNRKGHLLIEVTVPIQGFFDYGNLGYYAGAIAHDRNPVFLGIPPTATADELKILGAALASSGAVALFHAVGVTPEARTLEEAFGGAPPGDKIEVARKELAQVDEKLNTARTSNVDWIFLGCPHISIQEFAEIAGLLDGKRIKSGVDLWVSSSPATKALSDIMGYSQIIEKAGARIVCETCPVLALTSQISERKGFTCITTNSAKMAHYMPGQFGIMSHYGTLSKCIEAACRGRWE